MKLNKVLNELYAEGGEKGWEIVVGDKRYHDPKTLPSGAQEAFGFVRKVLQQNRLVKNIRKYKKPWDIVMKGDGSAVIVADEAAFGQINDKRITKEGPNKIRIEDEKLKFNE